MTIRDKIKSFLSKKIELKLFGAIGKSSRSDTFLFYLPTSDRLFKIEKNFVSSFSASPTTEKVITFLTPQTVRNEELTLSKFIPSSELASNIEIKAFDELGLDAELDYKIVFEPNVTLSEKRIDQNSVYNTYIVSSLEADGFLSNLLQKSRYIDSLLFAPLSFKRFYKEGYLQDNKTYALVYMYKNLTVLSIYDGGELMYIKGLKVTIDGYYEKYCDSVGDKLSFGEFIKIFCGVVTAEASSSFVTESRVELFKAFSDVLTHAKRLLSFEKYDAIFISSEYGDLVGVDELAKQYFETPVKHLNFKLALFGEQLDALSSAIVLDAIDGENLEFTMRPRPLPVIQRKSGRFLAVCFASLLIFSSFPFLKYLLLSENTSKLQKEYDRIGAKQAEAEALIGQKSQEVKALEAQINSEKNISAQKSVILAQLAKTKESNASISPMLVKVSNIAYSNGVKFDAVEINASRVEITIKSAVPSAFTKFVKSLSAQGIKTKAGELKRDENSTVYIGLVEVSR